MSRRYVGGDPCAHGTLENEVGGTETEGSSLHVVGHRGDFVEVDDRVGEYRLGVVAIGTPGCEDGRGDGGKKAEELHYDFGIHCVDEAVGGSGGRRAGSDVTDVGT